MFAQRLRTHRSRFWYLSGLAFLLLSASSGLLSCGGSNQPNVNPANATATAIANDNATALARVSNLLTATALAYATATASVVAANPYPSYLPGRGTLVLYNPNPGRWVSEGNQPLTIGNFALEIRVTLLKDGFCGDIFFRTDVSNKFYGYSFVLCPDGTYFLDNEVGDHPITLTDGRKSSPAIITGLNQSNLIAIVAQGSKLMFYANRQQILALTDNTYRDGLILLLTPQDEAKFIDAKVWTLL